jgi:hypothetical protein
MTRAAEGGQLVDFAVCLQARDPEADEGWIDLERVDTAHGHVHVDKSDGNGKFVKDFTIVPADCRKDLDKAYKWASARIWTIAGG